MFILLSLKTGELFLPSNQELLAYGVKDPVLLAKGEVWRLFSSMFLHIGLVHFILNNMGLFYIGRIIEPILGSVGFLFTYISSGVVGNINSTFFHLSPGAGASGAIFGLIGIGCILERRYPKLFNIPYQSINHLPFVVRLWKFLTLRGPFSFLVWLNLLLAVVLNVAFYLFEIPIKVDNAAHLGGLYVGLGIGAFYFYGNTKPTVSFRSMALALNLFICFLFVAWGVQTFRNTDYIMRRYLDQAYTASDKKIALFASIQALRIEQNNFSAYFRQGVLLIDLGWKKDGLISLWRASFLKNANVEEYQRFFEENKNRLEPSERLALRQIILRMSR